MTTFIPYLFKVSAALGLVYLVYFIFLRRLTFYNWNRWYLLLFTILSFVFPLINVSRLVGEVPSENQEVIQYIPSIYHFTMFNDAGNEYSFALNYSGVFLLLTGIGILFFLSRLTVQFFSFLKMRRSAKLIAAGPVKVFQVDDQIVPFSFANAIYINQGQHEDHELREIIRHEYVHVQQKHSVDIIIAEILCLLNWFNPFAWFLRESIRQNLEYIADQQVLRQGFDKKQYQYLLLKVTGVQPFSIANNFNFTSLKKRIQMMNKNRSSQIQVSRFLLMLPLVGLLLLAFRKEDSPEPQINSVLTNDTVPAKTSKVKPEDVEVLIEQIDINKRDNKNIITIRLKSGKTEQYNLNDPAEKKAFEEKYGEIVKPPAPPAAPVPPAAPLAPKAGNKDRATAPNPPIPPAAPAAPVAPAAPALPAESRGAVNLLKGDSVMFRGAPKDVLIVLDGKEMEPGTELGKIVKPHEIESLDVMKGSKAIEVYGEKAKNGVIRITTKK